MTPIKKPRKYTNRVRLSSFAKRLQSEWNRLTLPTENEKIVIAVSGGADSTALFLALDELVKARKLQLEITVAHLDHRLRKASKEDAEWVSRLAEELGYNFVIGGGKVKLRAQKTADNLEQAARRVRYEFLKKTADQTGASMLLTAHTLDDQAETILMRLLRGSAAEGLAGIESVRAFDAGSQLQLVRPLLYWSRRADTEAYCRARRIHFRVDEMNHDLKFTRVKIRKQLLPLMHSFNNKIVEALARAATLLREDATALSEEADKLLKAASNGQENQNRRNQMPALNVGILANAPPAVRRRAVRRWLALGRGDLRRLEMVHLKGVEALLQGMRGGREVHLPNGTRVVRHRGWIEMFVKKG